MLRETGPVAAIFVGGMSGILTEYQMFRDMFPGRPTYALGRPGGAARMLAQKASSSLAGELLEGDIYPALLRRILADVVESL
jgi:hypothetical protein